MCIRDSPYCGWSAGGNVACPTLRTTNDMPIAEPPSFNTFGFIPFQTNPHFISAAGTSGLNNETREDRLEAVSYTHLAPVRVTVTGPAGQIGYATLFRIASGAMFGPDQPVFLTLLERANPTSAAALKGVMMELSDCAFPLLAGMCAVQDPVEAFRDCEVALLIGARPRGPGMERRCV